MMCSSVRLRPLCWARSASSSRSSSPRATDMTRPRAVFLDRDGTLIRDAGYLADPAQVELLPNTIAGLELLRSCGLLLIVVSNQSGVGRGYYAGADLALVHACMASMLALHGLVLDGVYYCLHAPWD